MSWIQNLDFMPITAVWNITFVILNADLDKQNRAAFVHHAEKLFRISWRVILAVHVCFLYYARETPKQRRLGRPPITRIDANFSVSGTITCFLLLALSLCFYCQSSERLGFPMFLRVVFFLGWLFFLFVYSFVFVVQIVCCLWSCCIRCLKLTGDEKDQETR